MFRLSRLSSHSVFVVTVAALCSSAVHAVDLRGSYGRSRFLGDLSREAALPSYTLGVRRRSLSEGLSFAPGFDLLRVEPTHEGADFPFPGEAKLEVLSFLALASACWQTTSPWFVCGGLGVGNVNVNAAGYRQDYGSWHYEFSAAWQFGQLWAVELVSKYVGKVEQRIEGKDSQFALLYIGLGITYEIKLP